MCTVLSLWCWSTLCATGIPTGRKLNWYELIWIEIMNWYERIWTDMNWHLVSYILNWTLANWLSCSPSWIELWIALVNCLPKNMNQTFFLLVHVDSCWFRFFNFWIINFKNMIWYESTWTDQIQHDLIWFDVNSCEPMWNEILFWTNMKQYEILWMYMNQYESVWISNH